jgi:hypothetical protein
MCQIGRKPANMTMSGPLRAIGRPVAVAKVAALALVCTLTTSGVIAQTADQSADAGASQAPANSVGGMGNVNLYPKRIVLQGRDRIATVGVYNRARAEGRYDINVTDMMMTDAGNLVHFSSVKDEAALARVKTASSFLRWSPRKVTLPGSEAQTVRIMARVPPDLPPGEYRSHFSVVQVPPLSDDVDVSIGDGAGKPRSRGIGVRIMPRFGVSIPVIVRVGETTLQVGLRDFSVRPAAGGRSVVAFTITRSGTRSSFGDITVTSPGSSKPIAVIKGIGVYPEIDQRPMQLAIDPSVPASSYARGARLVVTYTDDDFRPGAILARQEFIVP